MENGTQMTLDEFIPGTFQNQTVGVLDSLVKTSQSQENNSDFKGTVQACFSELCTLSDSSKKKINPLSFSLKTLKICLVLMEDGISPDCSLKWTGGGYDAEWQVLNSKDFGVPQNRERCFVIGHLRGRSSSEVFPVKGTDGENSIQIIGHRDGFHRNLQVFSSNGITETLDAAQGGGRGAYTGVKILNREYHHEHEKIHSTDGTISTIIARDYKDPKQVAIPVLTPDRAEKRQNGRRMKDNGDPMFTLTSQDRHGVAIEPIGSVLKADNGIFVQISDEVIVYAVWYEKHQCYIAIRKLTPKECFRLQGWTDDYFEKAEFVNSDSQLYKQAGNGVTVTVIETMARKMEWKVN